MAQQQSVSPHRNAGAVPAHSHLKIVVIGGTGLIGSKLIVNLSGYGHESVAASPKSGVNTLTGDGLDEVLRDAQAVIDVSNSPSFADAEVMHFFETSTRNLLAAEARAGVRHHVALSVVGTDRMQTSGYFRAKLVQERLIKGSPIPYTIVRATQFFEFCKSIADASVSGGRARLPSALIQPIAAADVARELGKISVGMPLSGTVELGGPERFRLDQFVQRGLSAAGDPREVVSDLNARYFGLALEERTLVPEPDARLGETRFEEWLTLPISSR